MSCWRVFVSHHILSTERQQWLVGCVHMEKKFVCVIGFSNDMLVIPDNSRLSYVGHWNPLTSSYKNNVGKLCWVSLSATKSGSPLCSVLVKGIKEICTCVLFDPTKLMQSYVLTDTLTRIPPDTPDPSLTNINHVIWKLLTLDNVQCIGITRCDNKNKHVKDLAFSSARFFRWLFSFMVIFNVLLDNR